VAAAIVAGRLRAGKKVSASQTTMSTTRFTPELAPPET